MISQLYNRFTKISTPDDFIYKPFEPDYKIGGCWGSHVRWSDTEQFTEWDHSTLFNVWGHQPKRPSVGDTITGNFATTVIAFKFAEVEYTENPPDMFFGIVQPIGQWPK